MGIKQVSIKEIIENLGIIGLYSSDIPDIISNNKKALELQQYYKINTTDLDPLKLKQFFIQNEKFINKTNLILCLYKNCQEKLEKIKDKSSDLGIKYADYLEKCKKYFDFLPFGYICNQITTEKDGIINTRWEVLSTAYISNSEQNIKARTEFKNRKKENAVRLQKINENNTLKYKIQVIILSDLANVICGKYKTIGQHIACQIVENTIARENQLDENIPFQKFLPELEKALMEYCEYIDIDKLLLISAYRFLSAINTLKLENETIETVRQIVEEIMKDIEKPDTFFKAKIEETDSGESVLRKYSVKQLKKDLRRFVEPGVFMSDEKIQDTIKDLKSGKSKLSDFSSQVLDYLNSCIDINNWVIICNANENNLNYILNNYDNSINEIKELVLKIEKFNTEAVKLLIDKQIITEEEVNNLYSEKKISLEVWVQNISNSNEKIIDMYEKKEIIAEDVINLYKKSLIDKETMDILILDIELAEYVLDKLDSGQISYDLINNLDFELDSSKIIERYYCKEDNYKSYFPIVLGYAKSIINMEELNNLYKDGYIKEDDLYEMAKKSYFSYEKIRELYMNSLISENTLEKLKEDEIIDEIWVNKIKDELTTKEVIGNISSDLNFAYMEGGGFRLVPPDSKSFDYTQRTAKRTESNILPEIKTVLDPFIREEKFKSLHALKIGREDIECDEKNAFYNYEFYIIPNEYGEITSESIVIAERFFENRNDIESKLAYGNATYLFKLKDLAVTSKKSKTETISNMKDGKNINMKRVVHCKNWPNLLDKQIAEMQGRKLESIYSQEELKYIEYVNTMITTEGRIFDVPVNQEDGVLHE